MSDQTTEQEARWYAVQTYAGHENKVRTLISRRIAEEPGDTPEEKQIQEVLVPTHEVVEVKGGKKVSKSKRLYPGYVLVKMVLNERTIHEINNIQGVIKFVGGGALPQPLREDEINKILGVETVVSGEEAEEEHRVPFYVGQSVEVAEGPFSDFTGTIEHIDHEKGKVKVQVSLFGRSTTIELDYTQLKGY
ncbi:MAG: transcription termination/antitermination factor NusG [Gemmatimonadota bacterium]|nr:MAG: transcription termination/antitermination factor NusG [Gemmatimonadota bacterium]